MGQPRPPGPALRGGRADPEAIEAFSGQPAFQPVRAFVGVGSDRDIDLREEARRAVDKLERTGGFDRAVLNVATGTGRGWVNENQAQALEYMWERRHRHRQHAVLLPAELDVLPRRR